MIGFQLSNGDVITARVTQKVEFELNNSALESNLIPGSHSMEVAIDDVGGNMRKLQNAYRYDVLERNTVFDGVRLTVFGMSEYLGKLVVRRIRTNGIDAFMVINGFSVEILDMLLTAIDYGSPVNLGSTAAAISTAAAGYVTQSWPDVDFNFPTIYAPNLYNDQALGWASVDTVDEYENDQAYNLRALVKWVDGYVYVCTDGTTAGESPDSAPSKWQVLVSNCIINNWDAASGNFHTNDKTYLYTQNAHALSPQLYDKFVLKSIETSIGYRIIGEFMQDAFTDQSQLLNTEVLDSEPDKVVVKAEQDGVADPNTNPNASGGVFQTGIGMSSYFFHFNNEITDPDNDWTVENPTPAYPNPPSYYTIHSEGLHRITLYLDLISPSGNPPYDIKTQVNGIDIDLFQFTTTSGVLQHTIEWFAPSGNIGDTIAVQVIDALGAGVFDWNAGSYIQIENLSTNNYNAWNGEVNHANHVPDVPVRQYLLSLKKRFNLTVNLDFFNRTIELNYCKNILERKPNDFTDIIQDPVADVQAAQGATITEAPQVEVSHSDGSEFELAATYTTYQNMVDAIDTHALDDVVLVTAQFAFYRLGQTNTGTLEWQFEASKLPPLIYGNGARQITMIDQPAQLKYLYNDGDMMLLPWFNTQGNTVLFGGIDKDKPIVHAMWHGMQDAENGTYQYPFASASIYAADGSTIGTLDLRFIDALPQSVWEQYHKDWIRKVDYSLVFETDAALNYKQIFELDFNSPIRRRFIQYVLKRVIYDIDQNGVITAEIQAVQIMP